MPVPSGAVSMVPRSSPAIFSRVVFRFTPWPFSVAFSRSAPQWGLLPAALSCGVSTNGRFMHVVRHAKPRHKRSIPFDAGDSGMHSFAMSSAKKSSANWRRMHSNDHLRGLRDFPVRVGFGWRDDKASIGDRNHADLSPNLDL